MKNQYGNRPTVDIPNTTAGWKYPRSGDSIWAKPFKSPPGIILHQKFKQSVIEAAAMNEPVRPSNSECHRRYDRVEQLTKAGLSAPEIARITGFSTRLVERARQKRGLCTPKPPEPSPEQLERALTLLQEGSGYQAAAEATGIGRFLLTQRFPGMGCPKDESLRRAWLGQKLSKVLREI